MVTEFAKEDTNDIELSRIIFDDAEFLEMKNMETCDEWRKIKFAESFCMVVIN